MSTYATASPPLVLIDDDIYNGYDEYTLYEHAGVIPIFPPAMVRLPPNDTSCLCSDLQTEDYSPIYAWFNWVLIILGLPHLSVFGVLTNIVNVYVYSRSRMSSSANTYLLFLACSDFMVIVTGVFIFWIDSARSYIDSLSRAPYTTVYALPFGYMAQTCSIYFTVAAAVDCYVNVCWRSLRSSYCSVRRARIILHGLLRPPKMRAFEHGVRDLF
uniref:G_PROTEIN_RECEP_F1_2 domain-containing protein n=1 Tax=Panagrellus redivivus TaxID=6233 RepID=A0A7E4W956_PANRE